MLLRGFENLENVEWSLSRFASVPEVGGSPCIRHPFGRRDSFGGVLLGVQLYL